MTEDHDRPHRPDGTASSPPPLASVTPLRPDDRPGGPAHPAAPSARPDRLDERPSRRPSARASSRPVAGSPVVDALELCEALATATGCPVVILRNRERPMDGTLLAVSVDEVEVPGWGTRHVVHLLVDRSGARGPVPVMVSLLTGVASDADFFFPLCPIRVERPDGPIELHLR